MDVSETPASDLSSPPYQEQRSTETTQRAVQPRFRGSDARLDSALGAEHRTTIIDATERPGIVDQPAKSHVEPTRSTDWAQRYAVFRPEAPR